jgi:hypothetical protein
LYVLSINILTLFISDLTAKKQKKIKTYDIGNPGPGLVLALKCRGGGLNQLMESQQPTPVDN